MTRHSTHRLSCPSIFALLLALASGCDRDDGDTSAGDDAGTSGAASTGADDPTGDSGDAPTTDATTGPSGAATTGADDSATATSSPDPSGDPTGSPDTGKPDPGETGDTDPPDECPSFYDGVCDEPELGNGSCAIGTDYFDCGYCLWPGDGVCDEGTYCPAGTDPQDCAQQAKTCTQLEIGVIMACADLKVTLGGSFCLGVGICAGELTADGTISTGCLECGQGVSIGACNDGVNPAQIEWYCQAG